MKEEKIIINIDDKGNVDAETFDIEGEKCLIVLDKLMKGLALESTKEKKPEYYSNKTESAVRNKTKIGYND